jgi:hypothetical protein
MPNRDAHLPGGAVPGAAYATYHAWGHPGPHISAEAAGGLVGRLGGGLLPDWMDTPCSRRHRAEAHSMSITGTVGDYMNQQLRQWQANLRAEAQCYAQWRAASTSVLPRSETAHLNSLSVFCPGCWPDSLVMPRTWH